MFSQMIIAEAIEDMNKIQKYFYSTNKSKQMGFLSFPVFDFYLFPHTMHHLSVTQTLSLFPKFHSF